jgi:toxin ParE1/3/4
LKPALLRPQARRDRESEVRYYRKQAGTAVALRVVAATGAALQQIEQEPGMGSPVLGKRLGIAGLRAWRVNRLPLVWLYFVRDDHLDVVRLLGERQDIPAVLARMGWKGALPEA